MKALKVLGVIFIIYISAYFISGLTGIDAFGCFFVAILLYFGVTKGKKFILWLQTHGAKDLNPKTQVTGSNPVDAVILKCAKCNEKITVNDKFCGKCGAAIEGDNIKVEENPEAINKPKEEPKKILSSHDFDPKFSLTEDKMLESFINEEIAKAKMFENKELLPEGIVNKKRIFNIIFSFLVFVFVALIFFHFPIWTYLIGLVILFITYKKTRNYDMMTYLKKQAISRPGEKISNIVMNAKVNCVIDNSKKILIVGLVIAVILPMVMFFKPVILYEKMDNGYAVRYYIFGLTNFTNVTIPEKHRGKDVVSLRGNTFSNMPFISKVTLPDTIKEIRGQAFKNVKSLKEIKLPSKLEYLGGGAFYNCTSLRHIEIPDTVTYIGGEAFYNAEYLTSVKLSDNITEIRGSTFENCDMLKEITIPDKVTRIGGHAFYGNTSLEKVNIGADSKLEEIGSSAFRLCHSLEEITIPANVYVNERAFKESPTRINRIGEVEAHTTDSYKFNAIVYEKIGVKSLATKYGRDAVMKSVYLTVKSRNINDKFYEYIVEYDDGNEIKEYILNIDTPFAIVNENFAFEIEKYYFKYDYDKVWIDTYYN